MFSALANATTIDGSTWGTFYDSLEVMAGELPADAKITLNEDIHLIDQYYFGQYADGISTQLGDLRFRDSLSGLSASEIHELALKITKIKK